MVFLTRETRHVKIRENIIYCANSIASKWESRQYVSLAKHLRRVTFPATALCPGAELGLPRGTFSCSGNITKLL